MQMQKNLAKQSINFCCNESITLLVHWTIKVLNWDSNVRLLGVQELPLTSVHKYSFTLRYKQIHACAYALNAHTTLFSAYFSSTFIWFPSYQDPPPLSTLFLLLLPAEVFGWLKYAHRPLRDSPWRMALRATPIWFSPFDEFIAGILKMKLEGRLPETVFPTQVP